MMGVDDNIVPIAAMLVPIVGSIALFSFLGVASWSEARRKEREAYYTAETLKKIAESSGEGTKSAVEYLQETNRNARQRRIEGIKLGGLITAAVGIGLMVFLRGVEHEEPVYLVGLIPLLIGLALIIYAFALVPRAEANA
jgi:Flp pilus assembly protein TadB